ncbi:MAG: 2-hydroxymuconic semialdehyde dehydrogenase [Gammaproteobacteria bacterium]|nr:2-hydroxymuconic semialdehyde dehydrogenase [Gammaproteobacteria bacterium]
MSPDAARKPQTANREVMHFIDGHYVPSCSGKTFEDISPVDGSVIATVHEAGKAEVDQAVAAARAALNGPWGKLTTPERTALLHHLANCIEKRFDEFVETECLDTGKPYSDCSHIDIPRGAANFRVFADIVKNIPTEAFTMHAPDGANVLNYALRVPKGVVATICPWNLPLMLMTWKVGPALACGNTVVVKPSEETPLTTSLLGEVMNEAGIPPGVYNVVNGFGPDSAGTYLTEHPDVDAITFTGETRTGEAIMRAAAKGLRAVSFELGGKNPALVFADCDLDLAIANTVRSTFVNCGQVCLGTERIYVERSLFPTFVQRLKEAAEKLKIGPPKEPGVTLGPLISQVHRDKVLSYYRLAVEEGATVVTGGGIPDMPGELKNGSWVQPTIWTGLSPDARTNREEVFGPCCHIAPFDTEEEAIRIANDTPYGLTSVVWTRDLSRAHRVAAQLQSGITWINSWFLRDLRTPFGGMKHSGIGREGGVHSLEFYTELRNICIRY